MHGDAMPSELALLSALPERFTAAVKVGRFAPSVDAVT